MKQWDRGWTLYLLVVAGAAVLSVLASKFVSVAATQMNEQRQPATIVIDAGHGGEDGGAVSVTGVPESRINLEIAGRLCDLLKLAGYPVKMLRTTDTALYSDDAQTYSQKKVSDLKNRVQIVNGTPNAVLISVHQNHFTQSRYRGAQVFYPQTQSSREFAELMRDALLQLPQQEQSRQIKQASGVYLMEHISCPAVLVECGFLSNPEEEALLRTPAYQCALSEAIASAAGRFLAQQNAA